MVAGTIGGVAVILLLQALGRALYAPAGVTTGTASIGELVTAMPFGARLLVALGWFAGSAVGGGLALRLSGWRPAALIVAALLALGGLVTVTRIPHPLWMTIAAVVAPLLAIPAAHVVAHWSRRRSEELR